MDTALSIAAGLATAGLVVSALLLLSLLALSRRGRTASEAAHTLTGLLPRPVNAFFSLVGTLVIRLSVRRGGTTRAARRDARVGLWLRAIGGLLPEGEEWRREEMMDERNALRRERGRVPVRHYLRLLASVGTIRWEAWRYPERRVD
ncbi:hypothetical protein [Streptomyces sp. 16-176A]|uniref:hypothetical protein n=1 Tax=Streptomyces sp. 16-176A TaxID=2530458 RepID=UPI00345C83C3